MNAETGMAGAQTDHYAEAERRLQTAKQTGRRGCHRPAHGTRRNP